MNLRRLVAGASAVLAACSAPQQLIAPPASSSLTAPAPEVSSGYRANLVSVRATRHMAAAEDARAAEAGRAILRQGGSAVDAAIAMQAVLSLVEPQASGIGGGAFLMVWDGERVTSYDGRETAPAGATESLFIGADGKPMTFDKARIGGRSVGTPGVLRALEVAHKAHGRLPWAQLFEPAIRLCEEGFRISPRLHAQLVADEFLATSPAMAAYFLEADGRPKAVGTMLRNPALAAVLRRIAREGAGAPLYRFTGRGDRVAGARQPQPGKPGALRSARLRSQRTNARVRRL